MWLCCITVILALERSTNGYSTDKSRHKCNLKAQKRKRNEATPSSAGASSMELSLNASCKHYTWIPRKSGISQKPDSADPCVRKWLLLLVKSGQSESGFLWSFFVPYGYGLYRIIKHLSLSLHNHMQSSVYNMGLSTDMESSHILYNGTFCRLGENRQTYSLWILARNIMRAMGRCYIITVCNWARLLPLKMLFWLRLQIVASPLQWETPVGEFGSCSLVICC